MGGIFGLFVLATTVAVSWLSYGTARRFVRERLRYVEAALKPSGALIAGVIAFLIAIPVVTIVHLVPLLGALFAGGLPLVFGVSVGLGVHTGANDVKKGYVIGPGT